MRNIILLCLLLVAVTFGQETYDTSRFKNVDVDEILSNERLVNNYFKCLMGRGNCTPDGEELKKILPDAIQTGCVKCTEAQKVVAKKVSDKLRQNYASIWKELTDKYDPDGTYREKYKEELANAGFLEE